MRRNTTISIDVISTARSIGSLEQVLDDLERSGLRLSNGAAINIVKGYLKALNALVEGVDG